MSCSRIDSLVAQILLAVFLALVIDKVLPEHFPIFERPDPPPSPTWTAYPHNQPWCAQCQPTGQVQESQPFSPMTLSNAMSLVGRSLDTQQNGVVGSPIYPPSDSGMVDSAEGWMRQRCMNQWVGSRVPIRYGGILLWIERFAVFPDRASVVVRISQDQSRYAPSSVAWSNAFPMQRLRYEFHPVNGQWQIAKAEVV